MAWGDIDRNALIESFSKIKEDITKLKIEIENLKSENTYLKEKVSLYENFYEKIKLDDKNFKIENIPSKNTEKEIKELNVDLIKNVVKESIEIALRKQKKPAFIEKINKKRKTFLINRIINLAEKKTHSISEIKDIIVDQENLCSKATFYRYIEKLKKKQVIDILNINENEIVAKISEN